MTDPLTRAKQLIAIAVNPGAHKEEQRTAAHAAAQLIDKHKLLDRPPAFDANGVFIHANAEGGAEVESLFRIMQDLFMSRRPPQRPPPPPPARPQPSGPSPYSKPSWMADDEWHMRVQLAFEELRVRAPNVPEPTLRRAAESQVLSQIGAEQQRHASRRKR